VHLCKLSGGTISSETSTLNPSGTSYWSWYVSVSQTSTLTLVCTNTTSGVSATKSIGITVATAAPSAPNTSQPVISSMAATPSTVTPSQNPQITATASYAHTCKLSGGSIAPETLTANPNGPSSWTWYIPTAQTSTYTLACTNSTSGLTATKSVLVTVATGANSYSALYNILQQLQQYLNTQ
jgi:hypothetical protein